MFHFHLYLYSFIFLDLYSSTYDLFFSPLSIIWEGKGFGKSYGCERNIDKYDKQSRFIYKLWIILSVFNIYSKACNYKYNGKPPWQVTRIYACIFIHTEEINARIDKEHISDKNLFLSILYKFIRVQRRC